MGARTPRLILLEASKVRSYHSTFVDGIIQAFLQSGLSEEWGKPILHAHRSFFAHLSQSSRNGVEYHSIRVVDQDQRRLMRKSLVEAWNVMVSLLKMHRDDVLVVTTIMPSAMLPVELFKWLFPRRRLVMFIHGEIEAAFVDTHRRIGSYGFYIKLWLKIRRVHSTTEVAVIDTFIADALAERLPVEFSRTPIHAVPHAVVPLSHDRLIPSGQLVRCCFIGYITPNKGYPTFERLASSTPGVEFCVIGAGKVRELTHQTTRAIHNIIEFSDAVAACDIAILPYSNGYDHSLSAAAMDALAAGLHLLATDRGCFVALAREFGAASVTLCSESEMADRLNDRVWLQSIAEGRAERLALIERSRYGLGGVGAAIGQMLDGSQSRTAPPHHASAIQEGRQ